MERKNRERMVQLENEKEDLREKTWTRVIQQDNRDSEELRTPVRKWMRLTTISTNEANKLLAIDHWTRQS